MPLTPVTRNEIYLAKASGDYSGDLPEAITREEKYLKKIAENGSGGGTVDAYTKSETDALLANKADKATTYTKTEVDTALELKANLSTFVGITQAEYDALETKTEPMYFIYEEESTVSNSAGTNSMNTLETSSISPISGNLMSDTLNFSEPEKEISTDEIKPVSDLTVQGDETE